MFTMVLFGNSFAAIPSLGYSKKKKYLQFWNNTNVTIFITCKLSKSGLESKTSIDPNEKVVIKCMDKSEYGIVSIGRSKTKSEITGLRILDGVKISTVTYMYLPPLP